MDYTNLKVAFRDSTTATRSYVLINPLLGKHLAVEPSQSLAYFELLGKCVADVCVGERILVIGFAETATAVGAAVAALVENAVYVHTTREVLPLEKLVAQFKEEHSHAKNQALYLDEEYRDISQFDRIVFVEDEITTGKTILNFLTSIEWTGKIIVSALVFNGVDKSVFSEYDTVFICLEETVSVKYIDIGAALNPRSGVEIKQYVDSCKKLTGEVIAELNPADITGRDILIIGTEEFMYPALHLGSELEKSARSVKTHSTTRSPLLPREDEEYPVKTRNCFPSAYDSSRMTYIYNLMKYDTVIVITDSDKCCDTELMRIIASYGNRTIYSVRAYHEK